MSISIVAVHGLEGDWEGTWIDRESKKLWLRDFLPSEFPGARVWSYGYDSSTAFSKAVTDIDQVATMLLETLRVERRQKDDEGKPIIFISHSLGGIIVKKALILAHERSHIYGRLLESVRGVVFFAVPHRGSTLAGWATLAANICKTVTLGMATNPTFVEALKENSKEFATISKQFVERSQRLHIRTFYETERTGGQIVVKEDSARLNIAQEVPVPLQNTNHITICKFRSTQNGNYRLVVGAIEDLVQIATS